MLAHKTQASLTNNQAINQPTYLAAREKGGSRFNNGNNDGGSKAAY